MAQLFGIHLTCAPWLGKDRLMRMTFGLQEKLPRMGLAFESNDFCKKWGVEEEVESVYVPY